MIPSSIIYDEHFTIEEEFMEIADIEVDLKRSRSSPTSLPSPKSRHSSGEIEKNQYSTKVIKKRSSKQIEVELPTTNNQIEEEMGNNPTSGENEKIKQTQKEEKENVTKNEKEEENHNGKDKEENGVEVKLPQSFCYFLNMCIFCE